MLKYLKLLNISWQNGFVYRTSVYMWRIRQFLASLMALTIWTVIFADNGSFDQYSRSEMITYIFLVAIFQNVILSSVLNGLAQTIYSGKISYELLKPVNIYVYLGVQDLADKLKNVAFIVTESVILFLMFKPEVIIPSLIIIFSVIGLVLMATLLNFLISLLFGSLGFWSPDTWAPRFLFYMFVEFTAGRLFPLDILPKLIQDIVFLTPFPYLSFVQTQLFLGKIPTNEVVNHFAILGGWLILFTIIVKLVWSKGLKDYSATGQ